MADIYIGTILLEKNRWKPGRIPSYEVSQWLDRFRNAGFDGMEVWENHALLCSPEELERLRTSTFPVAIFNTYAAFDQAGDSDRAKAAELANGLRAAGLKFNLGPDPSRMEEYKKAARLWAELFSPETRLLCECHTGSVMETPNVAAQVFDQLGDPRFQAIVHAFAEPPEKLREWFKHLGPRVTHVHVQLRNQHGGIQCLEENPGYVQEILSVLEDERFAGTYTLEFTGGTSAPDENAEALFEAALRDLAFLRARESL